MKSFANFCEQRLEGMAFALIRSMEVGKPHASQPVPMLYVALVLGSAWLLPRRSTLRVAAGCTILTLLGSILPPPSMTIWFSEAPPALVLASMSVAAVIVHLQKPAEGCCDRGRARPAKVRTKAGGSALSLLVMTYEDSFVKAVSNASNPA